MPKPIQLIAAVRIMWILLALAGLIVLAPVFFGNFAVTTPMDLLPLVLIVLTIAFLALIIRAVSQGETGRASLTPYLRA